MVFKHICTLVGAVMSAAFLSSVVTMLASGCYYYDESVSHVDRHGGCTTCVDNVHDSSSLDTGSDIVRVWIDTDATMTFDEGRGVGVFIEYERGGRWWISTSCDTVYSGYACAFHVDATFDSGIVPEVVYSTGDERIEASLGRLGITQYVAYESQVVGFDVFPSGTSVQFAVYIDGEPETRYTYWVGDNAVHYGAPSNPLELVPSSP